MKDRELLKQLELKLIGRSMRIQDLEREVQSLREQLAQVKNENINRIDDGSTNN